MRLLMNSYVPLITQVLTLKFIFHPDPLNSAFSSAASAHLLPLPRLHFAVFLQQTFNRAGSRSGAVGDRCHSSEHQL